MMRSYFLSAALIMVSASLQAQMTRISLAEMDASQTLDPEKTYWITDPGKEGFFVFAGKTINQKEDNGGTVVINEGLQVFKRVYDGHIDIRWFGGVPDAIVPQRGTLVRGTNNTPALQRAIDAADDNQLVVVPFGRWLFSSPLDSVRGPKRLNLKIEGDTYHNGSDFLIITNAGGMYEQHTVEFTGNATGTVNLPRHTKQTHDAGTQPDWSKLTGTLVKIYNTFQVSVQFNKVEGFQQPIEIIGGHGNGSQENTIAGRFFYRNANGITLTSLDGQSYCDKNVFTGVNNGTLRISGGLGLKIDGYAGKAPNGEVYNGAFRSNEFHLMIEQVDSVAECNGDITEPKFDITVEGGVNTGVFGKVGFRMRSVAPNFVRSPRYCGRGIYGASLIQNGMGIGGTIEVPVWNEKNWAYYGDNAIIDEKGNIVFRRPPGLTKAKRDAAPANFKFDPEPDR
jgi:hypothetical protein